MPYRGMLSGCDGEQDIVRCVIRFARIVKIQTLDIEAEGDGNTNSLYFSSSKSRFIN